MAVLTLGGGDMGVFGLSVSLIVGFSLPLLQATCGFCWRSTAGDWLAGTGGGGLDGGVSMVESEALKVLRPCADRLPAAVLPLSPGLHLGPLLLEPLVWGPAGVVAGAVIGVIT